MTKRGRTNGSPPLLKCDSSGMEKSHFVKRKRASQTAPPRRSMARSKSVAELGTSAAASPWPSSPDRRRSARDRSGASERHPRSRRAARGRARWLRSTSWRPPRGRSPTTCSPFKSRQRFDCRAVGSDRHGSRHVLGRGRIGRVFHHSADERIDGVHAFVDGKAFAGIGPRLEPGQAIFGNGRARVRRSDGEQPAGEK
jgi:hypothetical protein